MISAALFSAAAAVSLLTPPGAAPLNAGGGYGERASAYWTFPPEEGGTSRMFVFSEAYQGTNNSGPGAFAVVGLGVCVDYERDGEVSELCRGGGFQQALKPGEFESSPLLDDVRLRFAAGGFDHQVQWKSTDPAPNPNPHYGVGTSSGAADMSLQRQASAGGSVYGYAVGEALSKGAVVSRTAGGGGALNASTVDGWTVTRTLDDEGRFEITMERRR